jgi:hypothetical protein
LKEIIETQIDRGIQRRGEQEIERVFEKFAEKDGATLHLPASKLKSALQDLDILVPGQNQDLEQEYIFGRMDANQNGRLQRNEFVAAVSESRATLEEWAKGWNLKLAQLLADSIPRLNDENGQIKDPLSSISSLNEEHLKLVVKGFAYGLEKILNEECRKLRDALSKMQNMAEYSMAEKFEVPEMRCGKIEHFHEGLAARIGKY